MLVPQCLGPNGDGRFLKALVFIVLNGGMHQFAYFGTVLRNIGRYAGVGLTLNSFR